MKVHEYLNEISSNLPQGQVDFSKTCQISAIQLMKEEKWDWTYDNQNLLCSCERDALMSSIDL